MAPGESYPETLAEEKRAYENCANIHNLPEIFHYWSNRHIRPKFLPSGFGAANEMFPKFLAEHCAGTAPLRFVSLGCGNGDREIEFAVRLAASGHENFILDCVDVNPAMLDRGKIAARAAGVQNRLHFVEGDLNAWNPAQEYDAVAANQSLHHVVNLEGLLSQVKRSLRPGGSFLISDMIGRNGHRRWPEALDLVHRFWRKLPPSYRFNRQIHRYEELFEDYDCSTEGFEGVRSEDILPLLIDRFHFHLFIPFANVIDPFVDRSFGPNFDAAAEWDRHFIDQVHRCDEEGLASGRLTPTHLVAVLRNEPSSLVAPPESCVRRATKVYQRMNPPQTNYDWHSWPHDPQHELEVVCRRLAEVERTAARLPKLQQEFDDRTAWALRLDAQLAERRRDMRNPLRYLARGLKSIWKRFF